MKITRRLPLLAGILALGMGLPMFAQERQVTVTANIPVLMNMSVDTAAVTLNFTQSDYTSDGNGTKEAVNATTFSIASNTRWLLQVEADSANFTFVPLVLGGANHSKNASDLSVSPNGTASYSPVSITKQDIASGEPGGTTATGHTIPVSYKLVTTVAGDPPGAYTLTLTYTLMSQ